MRNFTPASGLAVLYRAFETQHAHDGASKRRAKKIGLTKEDLEQTSLGGEKLNAEDWRSGDRIWLVEPHRRSPTRKTKLSN